VRRLGDFVLLDELGRGGMGVVFRARQEALGRIVAVKILPSFAGLDREAVARFRREAETAAKLSHPGIVPVFAVGEEQGTYFYAMGLVNGPSLESVLGELEGRNASRLLGTLAEETSLGERCPAFTRSNSPAAAVGARYPASCAAIALDLANALCVAHHANVIHRDLKPSNVLLAPSGRPMVVDFGLARDQGAVGLTQSGDAIGTPSYMAPEQAYGLKDLDARVDVYGFGATLYEMLTLRPPFDGAHAADIMRRILEEEPVPVRAINARVPRSLANIVHKCLAKDRDARYPAMEAVEHDLRAFLDGRATTAQAPSPWQRTASFCTRHRRGIGVAAATTAVLSLAGVVAGMWSASRAHQEGLTRLDQAGIQLLERADLEAAQESYGRAEQLLADPQAVLAGRLRHLEAAFGAWYERVDKRPWLERLLATIPPDQRPPSWHLLERRLHGEAECRLDGTLIDAETTATLMRFTGERFEPVPGGWPKDGMLASGDYVVHLERPGLAPTAVAFTVERDAPQTVFVPRFDVGSVEEHEVVVASAGADGHCFVLARSELSGAQFHALIKDLSPAQRAEFDAVIADDPRLPVHDLSLRQARILAALAGGHLPSRAEFELAARATVSAAAMPYPWGKTFADRCVSADPVRASRPDPVAGRAEGASPFGVLHLVGNVAEIVAAGAERVARVVGGDFLSRPEQLTIDAGEPIAGPDRAVRRAGVRVARCLSGYGEAAGGAPAGEAKVDADARLDELWRAGTEVVLNEWDFGAKGDARLRLRLAGFHKGDGQLDVPLSTPGFLQTGAPRCRLGSAAVEPQRRTGLGGETTWLRVPTDSLVKRQLFRLEIETALVPLSGLLGRADGYVLHVPLKAVGSMPVCYRLVLPPRSVVDQVDPPARRSMQKDRPVLVWEFGSDGSGVRSFAGVVRFRQDGFLCRQWPTRGEAMGVVTELCTAMQARDSAALGRLLAPSFLLLPSGAGRDDLCSRGRSTHEWFDHLRFVDVTAVGDVVTAELLADWHVAENGTERQAADWPLRVHWQRDGEAVRVLQVSPATRGDSGCIDAGGVYVNDELLLRIEPAETFTLSRTAGHLAPMQVELSHATDPDCFVMVLGVFEERDGDELATWQRLADGFHTIGGDERCLGRGAGRFGTYAAEQEEWLFTARDCITRERWLEVSAGRRRVLLRLVAKGPSAEAATAQFEAAQPWFSAVLPRIRLE